MSEDYYYSDNLYIKKSNIHGYGVFAKKKIKKDSLIDSPRCIFVPKIFLNKIFLYIAHKLINKYEKKFIDKYKVLSFCRYIFEYRIPSDSIKTTVHIIPITLLLFSNSSKDCNVDLKYDLISKEFFFQANKDINQDDEILLDY